MGSKETQRLEPIIARDELVASFADRLNLLKYGEKTHVYAASLPLERTRKRCSDHAHFVLRAATACHAFSDGTALVCYSCPPPWPKCAASGLLKTRWCPSRAWMKGRRSDVDRSRVEPGVQVTWHAIAQQCFHGLHLVRHTCRHGRRAGLPRLRRASTLTPLRLWKRIPFDQG